MRVITIHQHYKWTDRQTTYHGITALRYAMLHTIKTKWHIFYGPTALQLPMLRHNHI